MNQYNEAYKQTNILGELQMQCTSPIGLYYYVKSSDHTTISELL